MFINSEYVSIKKEGHHCQNRCEKKFVQYFYKNMTETIINFKKLIIFFYYLNYLFERVPFI